MPQLSQMERRGERDLWRGDIWSMALDLRILAATVRIAVRLVAASRPTAARSRTAPRYLRPPGGRTRHRDSRRIRRIERHDVPLVAVLEPDLGARELALDWAAAVRID